MYDDLLGKKDKEKEKKAPRVGPTPRSAKWSIEEYEDQPYCFQCGGTSISIIDSKLSKLNLLKKVQCDTCFAEWNEVWNEVAELISIGFKF